MANYYYTTIKSDKMTQNIAAEIFNTLVNKRRVRYFDYDENQLKYNTRGLIDITTILEKYGFTNEEVEVKSEFDYV